jgi:hypothetical protein
MSRNKKIRALAICAFVLIAALIGACGERHPTTFVSQITGYNHSSNYIADFSVNGNWGGNIFVHSGGGKSTCCIELPLPWRSGITVEVDWVDEHGERHVRNVPVPPYTEKSLGIFNVHFLRDGNIKVFAINAGLGHPDYPLQGEEANLTPGVLNFQYSRPGSAAH